MEVPVLLVRPVVFMLAPAIMALLTNAPSGGFQRHNPMNEGCTRCLARCRRWPGLEAWFGAMEARPSFIGLKSDYYTHCHDLPPQLGGACCTAPGLPCGNLR